MSEIDIKNGQAAEAAAEDKPHCMVLRTEGLVKRYGKRTVVNDVSINVKQGEIVGLLGPNGAGKTTSFYMTTGLIVPNDGHIYLDDKDMPEARDGAEIAWLNLARCGAREAELAAAAAFTDPYGQVSRTDLLRAMNRLSSAIYLLMIRQRANRKEETP